MRRLEQGPRLELRPKLRSSTVWEQVQAIPHALARVDCCHLPVPPAWTAPRVSAPRVLVPWVSAPQLSVR